MHTLIYRASTNSHHSLLTIAEVADILRVDNTTVRRWVKQGTFEAVVLPHVNECQAYRIKRETVDKLLGQVSSVS